MEDFKDLLYNANPDIDVGTYLAAFLSCWLKWRAFTDSSTGIRPETFLNAVELVQDKQYSMVVQYLAWAYRALGEF